MADQKWNTSQSPEDAHKGVGYVMPGAEQAAEPQRAVQTTQSPPDQGQNANPSANPTFTQEELDAQLRQKRQEWEEELEENRKKAAAAAANPRMRSPKSSEAGEQKSKRGEEFDGDHDPKLFGEHKAHETIRLGFNAPPRRLYWIRKGWGRVNPPDAKGKHPHKVPGDVLLKAHGGGIIQYGLIDQGGNNQPIPFYGKRRDRRGRVPHFSVSDIRASTEAVFLHRNHPELSISRSLKPAVRETFWQCAMERNLESILSGDPNPFFLRIKGFEPKVGTKKAIDTLLKGQPEEVKEAFWRGMEGGNAGLDPALGFTGTAGKGAAYKDYDVKKKGEKDKANDKPGFLSRAKNALAARWHEIGRKKKGQQQAAAQTTAAQSDANTVKTYDPYAPTGPAMLNAGPAPKETWAPMPRKPQPQPEPFVAAQPVKTTPGMPLPAAAAQTKPLGGAAAGPTLGAGTPPSAEDTPPPSSRRWPDDKVPYDDILARAQKDGSVSIQSIAKQYGVSATRAEKVVIRMQEEGIVSAPDADGKANVVRKHFRIASEPQPFGSAPDGPRMLPPGPSASPRA